MAADYAVSFLITFLVAKPLGPAAYGFVPLVSSITEAPRLILVSALGTSMARHIAPVAESALGRAKQVLRAGLLLFVLLGSAMTALCFVGADAFAGAYHMPELVGLLRIAAVGLLGAGLLSFVQAAFQGLNQLGLLAGSSILNSAVRLVLTLLLVQVLHLGAAGALWGTALGYLAAGALYLPLLWARWWRPARAVGPLPWAAILRYSRPLLVSTVAFFAFTRIDVMILGFFARDPAEVGYLGLASAAFALPMALGQAAANAAFPTVSALAAHRDTDRMQRLYDRLTYWLTFYSVPACVAVVVLSRPLFGLALPEYAAVADLLRVLAPLILLKTLSGLCTAGYLIATGHAQAVAQLNVIGAVANVTLDLILIPPLGAMGSAIGTLIVHGGLSLASIWLTQRKLGVAFKVPWGVMLGGFAILGMMYRASALQADATILGALLYYLVGLCGFLGLALLLGC